MEVKREWWLLWEMEGRFNLPERHEPADSELAMNSATDGQPAV
jgi:hypothetical protein